MCHPLTPLPIPHYRMFCLFAAWHFGVIRPPRLNDAPELRRRWRASCRGYTRKLWFTAGAWDLGGLTRGFGTRLAASWHFSPLHSSAARASCGCTVDDLFALSGPGMDFFFYIYCMYSPISFLLHKSHRSLGASCLQLPVFSLSHLSLPVNTVPVPATLFNALLFPSSSRSV